MNNNIPLSLLLIVQEWNRDRSPFNGSTMFYPRDFRVQVCRPTGRMETVATGETWSEVETQLQAFVDTDGKSFDG